MTYCVSLNCDRWACHHMEDLKYVLGYVQTHGELIRTGAANCDAFINYKLAAGQINRASYRKVNRVAVVGIKERLPQRPGAAVVCVGDRDRVCRPVCLSWDSLCECEWDYARGGQ